MTDTSMYPPIFLPIPDDDMLVHLQVSISCTAEHLVTMAFVIKGGKKASGVVYREGKEWTKGQILNNTNNLYCAQDIRTGTIMAVTQVTCYGTTETCVED